MFKFNFIEITNTVIFNLNTLQNNNVNKECEGDYLHHLFDLRLNSFKIPFLLEFRKCAITLFRNKFSSIFMMKEFHLYNNVNIYVYKYSINVSHYPFS